MHNLDLLAALPPPSDDEPPSLRSDIVDELLDHLQCAFRREVLKDGDEAAAEQRVLDRFGDPKKLARRLWWQAMWSRIMGKQILSGLQWLVSLAAVCLAGGVFWQQSRLLKEMADNQNAENHWRQNLSLTLNDLRSRLPAPATNIAAVPEEPASGGGGAGAISSMMGGGGFGPAAGAITSSPTLTVKLVQENADGPPVTTPIKEISLTTGNRTRNGISQQVPHVPGGSAMMMPGSGAMAGGAMPGGLTLASADGCFTFNNLEPNRYELKVTLEDGQFSTQSVVIHDAKPRQITIACPPPRERVPVSITAPPLPPDLRTGGWTLSYAIKEEKISTGKTGWDGPDLKTHTLHFDPETGQLVQIVSQVGTGGMGGKGMGGGMAATSTDVSHSDSADRVVFLLIGPTTARYQLNPPSNRAPRERKLANHAVTFPPFTSDQSAQAPISRTVKRDELEWQLDLPEELLDLARKQMESFESPADLVELKGGRDRRKGGITLRGGKSKGAAAVGAKKNTDDEPLGDNARLIVKLTSETIDGPTPEAEGVKIAIRTQQGEIIPSLGRRESIPFSEEEQAWIATVESGRYTLGISFPDGRHLNERLPLLRPGHERVLHIVCPPPVKQGTVLLKAPPVPEEFRQRGLKFRADFIRQPIPCDGRVWQLSPPPAGLTNNTYEIHNAYFDPDTGLVTQANGVDFTQDPPEDRILLLRIGVFRADYALTQPNNETVPPTDKVVFKYPPNVPGEEPVPLKPYEFTLDPGDNIWTLKLDDFWAAAKAALDAEKSQPESPGAKADSPKSSDESKLTLVAHTQGKPTAGVQVTLYPNETGRPFVEVGRGVSDDAGQLVFPDLSAGQYRAMIYAPHIELRADRIVDWDGKAPVIRVLELPAELYLTDLHLTTNLPPAALDAGLRVCVQFRSAPLPGVAGGDWRISQDRYESLVVGSQGIEGRLHLPEIVDREARLLALLNGQHRVEPVAPSNLRLPVLPAPLRVVSLGLICPASQESSSSEIKASQDNNWLVCAWTDSAASDLPKDQSPRAEYQLKKTATNTWTLEVPDDLIAIARSRLAKLKAEESSENGAAP